MPFKFLATQSISPSENGSQSFSAPQHKESSLRKDVALFLKPLELEVHTFLKQSDTRCICAGEDVSIVQSEKVVGLAGHLLLQQLASLISENLGECGINSSCWITPCQQVMVKFTTFLELTVYVT